MQDMEHTARLTLLHVALSVAVLHKCMPRGSWALSVGGQSAAGSGLVLVSCISRLPEAQP